MCEIERECLSFHQNNTVAVLSDYFHLYSDLRSFCERPGSTLQNI